MHFNYLSNDIDTDQLMRQFKNTVAGFDVTNLRVLDAKNCHPMQLFMHSFNSTQLPTADVFTGMNGIVKKIHLNRLRVV